MENYSSRKKWKKQIDDLKKSTSIFGKQLTIFDQLKQTTNENRDTTTNGGTPANS